MAQSKVKRIRPIDDRMASKECETSEGCGHPMFYTVETKKGHARFMQA